VALCGYYVLLFLIQRPLLYPAPRGPAVTAVPSGVQYVRLETADGAVDAWYVLPDSSATARHPAIIFTHGNGERAEDRTGQFRRLQREGVGILIPEYPGYGQSAGKPTQTSLTNAALVVESSFTSLRALARGLFAPGFLVRDPFDNLAELSGYRGPLLVLHGERDEIAPFAHGKALAARVPGAVFVPMPCGHNDCDRPWEDVLRFLAERQLVDSRPLT